MPRWIRSGELWQLAPPTRLPLASGQPPEHRRAVLEFLYQKQLKAA